MAVTRSVTAPQWYLFACIGSPVTAKVAVIVVGVLYAVEAIIGNVDGASILGVIPVDMRDLIVHPALAVLAVAAVLCHRVARRRSPIRQRNSRS